MRFLIHSLRQCAAILLLVSHVTVAQEVATTNVVGFSFIEPQIVPALGLSKEAMNPKSWRGWPSGIDFGKNHGSLSNVVAGHIATISVTWADTNRFKTPAQTEIVLRRLLSAPAGSNDTGSGCETYAHVPWAQVLGLPSIAARIEHSEGKTGQLLLFACGGAYLFAYEDWESKWWFGQWHERAQNW